MYWTKATNMPDPEPLHNEIEPPRHPTRRNHDYRPLVKDFASDTWSLGEVVYDTDTLAPATVVSGLRWALRDGQMGGIAVIRRGRRVFLSRTHGPLDARAYREAIEGALVEFRAGGESDVIVEIPEGIDTLAAYHALHYRRTALGYGDVTVSLRDGKIHLVRYDAE